MGKGKREIWIEEEPLFITFFSSSFFLCFFSSASFFLHEKLSGHCLLTKFLAPISLSSHPKKKELLFNCIITSKKKKNYNIQLTTTNKDPNFGRKKLLKRRKGQFFFTQQRFCNSNKYTGISSIPQLQMNSPIDRQVFFFCFKN